MLLRFLLMLVVFLLVLLTFLMVFAFVSTSESLKIINWNQKQFFKVTIFWCLMKTTTTTYQVHYECWIENDAIYFVDFLNGKILTFLPHYQQFMRPIPHIMHRVESRSKHRLFLIKLLNVGMFALTLNWFFYHFSYRCLYGRFRWLITV